MQSAQESKQELEAAIRYAENAISSANQTIESMEFRQEMAKKQYAEQTGREQALQAEVVSLREQIADMQSDMVGDADTIKQLNDDNADLRMQIEGHRTNMALMTDELDKLRSEKEASSAPCGCQAYRDLEEARGRAEGEVELLQRTVKELESKVQGQYDDIKMLERDLTVKEAQAEAWKKEARGTKATMPVIPKAVAIAIFREGVQHGVEAACTELEGGEVLVEESEYVGGFEVSFSKTIDLDDELDLDWMRGKVGRYDEGFVVDALKNLCADEKFECRIHGVDDQETKEDAD